MLSEIAKNELWIFFTIIDFRPNSVFYMISFITRYFIDLYQLILNMNISLGFDKVFHAIVGKNLDLFVQILNIFISIFSGQINIFAASLSHLFKSIE